MRYIGHMSVAEELAEEVGTTGRSIRRALNDGLIRGERPSPKKLVIGVRERIYLREYWEVLSDLRQALRTEPSVNLAVLYGSTARGEADQDSDIDILVELKRDDALTVSGVRRRLELAANREVGLARLPRVEADAPLLLAEILDEGRVLVDRANRWPALQAQRASIERRAQAAFVDEMSATRAALARMDELTQRRVRNIAGGLQALDLAMYEFGEDRLADPEWQRAFESGDPDDINKIIPVMSGYEHVIQNVIELAKAAGRVTGDLPGRRPRAEIAIEMLQTVSAVSKTDRARLDDLYVFRGRVSHESPDIGADEMARYAERALSEIPPMITGIRRWLAAEGLSF